MTRPPERRRAVLFAATLWAAAIAPGAANADPPPERIAAILAEMRSQGAQFRADRLHAMGVEGLSALLDWFLPETAAPKSAAEPDPRVAPLIAQLGHESSRVREAATRKLYELGIAAQAALVEAARNNDPEVSWRAVRILRAWESERNQDVNRYTAGLSVYLTGIADEARLQELARRSKLVLDGGLPASRGQQQVIRLCIMALTRAGNDEYTDGLRPLVKEGKAQEALFVVQAVANGMAGMNAAAPGQAHYPAILLDALESKEQQVLYMALNCTTAIPAGPRGDELKERLRGILKGADENVKLQACRLLIGLYGDAAALEHVRAMLADKNLSRRQQALNILGSPPAAGKAVHPQVLEILLAAIASGETNLRYTAANALANHSGEHVARALIPLLGDATPQVAAAARRGLLRQPDRQAVRDLLAAAAKDGANEKVKEQAAALVRQLDATPAPPANSRSSRILNRVPIFPPDLPDEDPFGP